MRAISLLALLVVACSSTTVVTRTERRMVIRVDVQRCLSNAPPAPPQVDTDPRINAARQADAYDALALWAYLYAWPSCRE